MRGDNHRSVTGTRSAVSAALSAVQVAGLALATIVGSAAVDAGSHGARDALELGASKVSQPHAAPVSANLVRARPLAPSFSFVAQAETVAPCVERALASDFAELGLRVRSPAREEAGEIERAGLNISDASVRVANAIAGHARGFERGDLIVATCDGAPVSEEEGCLLVVRDGTVLRL